MCGICGIWGESAREAVPAMVAAMHRRGPDDRGIFADSRASLGMTRLAIIDTSSGGHQPMFSDDRQIALIYNGELYNFREERRILEAQGQHFRSSSDTEVVLRMYEHYGDDFVKRMRGMFALAVYDKRGGPSRERLLLARDQMGIKPLLYARVGSRFIFASEIKALLASRLIEPKIDLVSLRLLLTYGSVYQPRTILSGVRMLLPGHRLILEGNRERLERYWSLGTNRVEGMRQRPYEATVEHMAHVLEESVRLQMVSDVPLGAFLSGGIDSSLLVAVMAQQVTSERVKTFSVGFGAEGHDIDETDDAQRTADFLGTEHTRVIVTGDHVRDSLTKIVSGLDQPSVDGINSYFVAQAARSAVTVAISGTGGDELFAGYPWFATMAVNESKGEGEATWKALAKAALAPAVHMKLLSASPQGRFSVHIQRLRYATDFRTRYANTYNIFGIDGAARILSRQVRSAAGAGGSARLDLDFTDELSQGTVIERITGVCLRGYTTSQLLRDLDAVSMAHSLEVRVPYLDPVVADTALSLPDQAKLADVAKLGLSPEGLSYRELGAKRILLDIGKRWLPQDFDLHSKRGFSMPFNAWLKGPLYDILEDTLCAQATRRRALFDEVAVNQTKEDFLAGRVSWTQPWLLMIVELWCRQLIDPPAMLEREVA